jgi:hypothetical protein
MKQAPPGGVLLLITPRKMSPPKQALGWVCVSPCKAGSAQRCCCIAQCQQTPPPPPSRSPSARERRQSAEAGRGLCGFTRRGELDSRARAVLLPEASSQKQTAPYQSYQLLRSFHAAGNLQVNFYRILSIFMKAIKSPPPCLP